MFPPSRGGVMHFSSSKPLLLEWVPSGCEHDVIFGVACSTGPGSILCIDIICGVLPQRAASPCATTDGAQYHVSYFALRRTPRIPRLPQKTKHVIIRCRRFRCGGL